MDNKYCTVCSEYFSSKLDKCPNCGRKLEVICSRCKNPLKDCVCKDWILITARILQQIDAGGEDAVNDAEGQGFYRAARANKSVKKGKAGRPPKVEEPFLGYFSRKK